MSSVTFVKSTQVIKVNEIPLNDCPKTMNIPCEHAVMQGVYWAVPVLEGGIQVDWQFVIGGTIPSPDSIKVIRIWDKLQNSTYWTPVDASTGSEALFVDRCNACCGSTPVMPTVTIPPVVSEICPCPADVSGTPTYTFEFPIPPNGNTLDYLIAGSSFNNVAGTPTPAAGGYANLAAMLTFLNTAVTGWAAYGTWSYTNSNTILKLVSTTVECAAVNIDLEAKSYCFEIPGTNTEVNGIKISSVETTFPNIIFSDATATTRQAIIDAIRPFLIGTLEVVEDSGDFFVKYTGLQLPNNLTLDSVNVSGTTFATGTCP